MKKLLWLVIITSLLHTPLVSALDHVEQVINKVDIVEINSFYEGNGNLNFDQLLLWSWDDRVDNYVIREWMILKGTRQEFNTNTEEGLLAKQQFMKESAAAIMKCNNWKRWPDGLNIPYIPKEIGTGDVDFLPNNRLVFRKDYQLFVVDYGIFRRTHTAKTIDGDGDGDPETENRLILPKNKRFPLIRPKGIYTQ